MLAEASCLHLKYELRMNSNELLSMNTRGSSRSVEHEIIVLEELRMHLSKN